MRAPATVLPLKFVVAAAIALTFAPTARSQTASGIVGSGFTAPIPITIAPGGLTTIFVQGIGTKISSSLVASSATLPVKLGGISVTLTQTEVPRGPIPVPILAIFPVAACRTPIFPSCGSVTGINIQVPFELVPNPSTPDPALSSVNFAQLTISEDGGPQATIEAIPVSDLIHIVRLGDMLTKPAAPTADRPISILPPAITHSDGTLVTAVTPANAGETLIMYAVGLGPVLPRIPSGEPTPNPPPTLLLQMSFEFRPNGTPNNPAFRLSSPLFIPGAPTFAGLTPGFVGLYQVNFIVPDVPSGYAVRCDSGGTSNMTVNLGRVTSFDGAGICVRIPVP